MSAPYQITFLVLAFLGGGLIGWEISPPQAAPETKAEPEIWTCPMHAEIKLPKFGPCPKCGMDLVKPEGSDAGPRSLVMSEANKKLAEIVTTKVERKFVTGQIQLVGKVDYDETRVKTISAWVPGRLDRLFVDYTGVPIRQGDHLVEMYSPMFLTAQEELVEAKKQVDAAVTETSEFLRQSNTRALNSAREKLRLWGLTAAQITTIETSGKVEDHVQIFSPMTGIVIHKNLNVGDYVKTGSRIYQIADLTHLWVQLDAYESDLPHIHYGQEVSIQTESYPGRLFKGWVSFIDPVLNQRTQTVRVRVNVKNLDGRLKPGMFVRTRIVTTPGQGGSGGIAARFANKWICPMHPEVVEDQQTACRVCGMDLVKAETLGKLIEHQDHAKPLVIPVTAALITGRRAVVYVVVPGKQRPTYAGREVVLGPRAGDYYQVLSGLQEGEEVVVHGNFKIDSALQILAKPSMMSMPADPGPMQGVEFLAFRNSLQPIYQAYFEIQEGLARDDAKAVRPAYQRLAGAIQTVPGESDLLPSAKARTTWIELRTGMLAAWARAKAAGDITALRLAFHALAEQMLAVEKTFGHSRETSHAEVYCSMAFDDQGAAWLQRDGPVRNPYFGASMLTCGEVKHRYAGRGGTPKIKPQQAKPAESRPSKPATLKKTTQPAVLSELWKSYLAAQSALAGDALSRATLAFGALAQASGTVDESQLSPTERDTWTAQHRILTAASLRGAAAADLATARVAFRDLTAAMLALEQQFGHRGKATLFEVFCPMAFDGKGGTWLQLTEKVSNPYYGASMLRCGAVKQKHTSRQGR